MIMTQFSRVEPAGECVLRRIFSECKFSMTKSPLDVIEALPWRHAVFSTYALSLAFFESVVLDALVRANCRSTTVLSDLDGVRMALGELGARRVGKDYQVEPVEVQRGIFHPKVTALIADDQAHVLVGSGNLTFGGWGQNLEVLEHLHPSFAAQAITDTAGFFEVLASSEFVQHQAGDTCMRVAGELMKLARVGGGDGEIRLFHNLKLSLFEQIIDAADSLGGAERLVVVSPYWDGGAAISRLCKGLKVDRVLVHVPANEIGRRITGYSWPKNADVPIKPVCVEAIESEVARPVHAKIYEIVCKNGRVIVSGSANATTAALDTGRNVEVCVVRVQRDEKARWSLKSASAPADFELQDQDADQKADEIGVLRAELVADRIEGRVFSSNLQPEIIAYLISSRGIESLGGLTLSAEKHFAFHAPELELRSWQGDRLTLRLVDSGGDKAEGFISIAAYQDVSRRVGPIASRLFAILSGTEAPEDVAAMLAWFQQNPDAFDLSVGPSGGASEGEKEKKPEPDILTDHLSGDFAVDLLDRLPGGGSSNIAAWRRFLELLHGAFRERRGPIHPTPAGDADDPEGEEAPGEAGSDFDAELRQRQKQVETACNELDRLIDVLTAGEASARKMRVAFYMCQFVCDRLRPEAARVIHWLGKVIRGLTKNPLEQDLIQDGAAATLIFACAVNMPNSALYVRNVLTKIGYRNFDELPTFEGVQGYAECLPPSVPYEALWQEAKSTTTWDEQRAAFLADLRAGDRDSAAYAGLLDAVSDLKPKLLAALKNQNAVGDFFIVDDVIEACPKCRRRLPVGQASHLRTYGICKAASCCGNIIIRK